MLHPCHPTKTEASPSTLPHLRTAASPRVLRAQPGESREPRRKGPWDHPHIHSPLLSPANDSMNSYDSTSVPVRSQLGDLLHCHGVSTN